MNKFLILTSELCNSQQIIKLPKAYCHSERQLARAIELYTDYFVKGIVDKKWESEGKIKYAQQKCSAFDKHDKKLCAKRKKHHHCSGLCQQHWYQLTNEQRYMHYLADIKQVANSVTVQLVDEIHQPYKY